MEKEILRATAKEWHKKNPNAVTLGKIKQYSIGYEFDVSPYLTIHKDNKYHLARCPRCISHTLRWKNRGEVETAEDLGSQEIKLYAICDTCGETIVHDDILIGDIVKPKRRNRDGETEDNTDRVSKRKSFSSNRIDEQEDEALLRNKRGRPLKGKERR